jgi:hypothetical protein
MLKCGYAVLYQPVVACRLRPRSSGGRRRRGKRKAYPAHATGLRGGWRAGDAEQKGDPCQMAECPRCGRDTVSFIHGVCRACYMRDYHQRRSAAAVTECPRCGGVSANFVHGVCRACYMRDYHQRRSAGVVTQRPSVTDGQRLSVTDGQSSPATDVQGVCETPALAHDSAGRHVCVECRRPGIYARGLCLSCYMRDHRRRTLACIDGSAGPRLCVECGELGIYARNLCQNCYMRDRRRLRRMKLRACAVCGVSFQCARSDALYCSPGCRQKAHRSGKTQAA